MTKKTILYTGDFELPDKNAAAQRVLANAKIFREIGFNVVFLGFDTTLPLYTNVEETRSSVQGFETWSVPHPSSGKRYWLSWLNYLTNSKPLEHIVSEFYNDDLYGVICYCTPSVVQFKIRSFCHRNKALFIPDMTEWYDCNGGGVGRWVFNVVRWLDTTSRVRFVNLKGDGIITTSQYMTDFYQKRKCKTVELPTLYDVENLSHLETISDRNDRVKIMCAGNGLIPDIRNRNRPSKERVDKVISMLYKVYQEKSNFIFDIFGLTQEDYLSVFPEHTDILHELSQVITFHGMKPHKEIIEHLQKSDFTIFIKDIHRRVEAGFPGKFAESISYGTPVICNRVSNIEKYSKEGKNMLILKLDDEDSQVKKMVEILNLTFEERKAMKDYCSNNKIFDYRHYINGVKDFLKGVENKYESI